MAGLRSEIKRKIDYSVKDLEAAQLLLMQAALPFEELHKEQYQQFCMLVSALEDLKKAIDLLNSSI